MIIMDGKNLQQEMVEELKALVYGLDSKPKLVIIQVGHDEASNR